MVGIRVGLLSAIRRYSVGDDSPRSSPRGRPPSRSSCSASSCSTSSPSTRTSSDWPEWARLRTSGIGPDTWTFFFIPTGEQWRYLVLPAITLACVSTALAARMTRGSMLEVLRADYMRTARAKGLTERQVDRAATACATPCSRSSRSSASTSARSSAPPCSPRPCSPGPAWARRSPTRSATATCRCCSASPWSSCSPTPSSTCWSTCPTPGSTPASASGGRALVTLIDNADPGAIEADDPTPATSPTSAPPGRCARTCGAASGATSWRWSASVIIVSSCWWRSSPRSSRPTDHRAHRASSAPRRRPTTGSAPTSIGHDVFSRVVYGARVSLRIGIIATAMSLVIGLVARCHRRLLRRHRPTR